MTTQEAFRRRMRDRMTQIGERFNAPRPASVGESTPSAKHSWAAEPETSDDAVRAATGRGWDQWCDVIDAWPSNARGHAAIAGHLQDSHGVDSWWAQTITVGYERITGRRLPYQQPDGTFRASKSRTVAVDAAELRALLLSDDDRADLFPGLATDLRSRPDTKVPRIAIGPGVAQIDIEPKPGGSATVTISHEELPEFEDVAHWKEYWSEWLAAIDAG